MKLDLILENVRNGYTLNLLEESAVHGVDEREVLMGKMLINESTMMVRRILVEEGVMQNVKALLENTFAQIIEEFSFDGDEVLDGASRVGKAIVNVPLGAADGLALTGGSIAKHIDNGDYGRAALTVGSAPIAVATGAGIGVYGGVAEDKILNGPVQVAKNAYNGFGSQMVADAGAAGGAGVLGLGAAGAGYFLGRRGIRR